MINKPSVMNKNCQQNKSTDHKGEIEFQKAIPGQYEPAKYKHIPKNKSANSAPLFDLLLLQIDERSDDNHNVVQQLQGPYVNTRHRRQYHVTLKTFQHALDVTF